MTRAWLIDFEDSFTHNVAAEMLLAGIECQVISWKKIPQTDIPDLLVLGPGPGHPDDYALSTHLLRWENLGVRLAGICLGHQLIARHLGLPVVRSLHPLHGQVVSLEAPLDWRELLGEERVVVQRYNSLAVPAKPLPVGWQGWQYEGEWIALRHERVISYQFHPESVGTSCPQAFFRTLTRL